MKKKILILFILCSISIFGQKPNTINQIVELSKIYNNYHNILSLENDSVFQKYNDVKFSKILTFLKESLKDNNKIADNRFLTKPDSTTLKLFHTMILVNYGSNTSDDKIIANRYLNSEISQYEQLQVYYRSLFTSIINKNKGFDYSNKNWNLEALGLIDRKEKAVFYLVFIDKLGSQIIHYLNAHKGPNWIGINKYVSLLPKIDGKNYYEYQNFLFDDFKISIYKKTREFKKYYLSKLYDILVGHALMLEENKAEVKNIQSYFSNSLLSKKEYYKYCDNRNLFEINRLIDKFRLTR